MAAFPEFFKKWVSQQPDLVTLVGTRVSPWQSIRKDTEPRITYTIISGLMVRGLGGPKMVSRQRWQIDCWGPKPAIAQQIAREVKGWTGTLRLDGIIRTTLAGVTVQSCVLEDERDTSESLVIDDEGAPCVSLDFAVAWNTQ